MHAGSTGTVEPELTRLDSELARTPGDPMLLFERAIAHAMLCDRERTLRELSAVAATWGGLDPGSFRGFAFLRGDPRFDALVRDIRARNPPALSSGTAYVLAEPGLFPEGMAFDGLTGRVYAGGAATPHRLDGPLRRPPRAGPLAPRRPWLPGGDEGGHRVKAAVRRERGELRPRKGRPRGGDRHPLLRARRRPTPPDAQASGGTYRISQRSGDRPVDRHYLRDEHLDRRG